MTAPVLPSLSTRQQLAQTALSAALAVDGVVAGSPGRLRNHLTPAGEELLHGVTATAEPGGRFSVELFLVCRPIALLPLAERVRERVQRAAAASGLQPQLGEVGVHIEDVEESLA